MKVLITGAAGFLGRNFLKHHVANKDSVVAIDDMSNEHSFWPQGVTEQFEGAHWYEDGSYLKIERDVLDFFNNPTHVAAFDLAYHFAAPVGGRAKIEGDPLFNAHSLALDSAFFRWAVKHTKRAVYPSSSAVYGVKDQRIDPTTGRGFSLSADMFNPLYEQWSRPDEMYGFGKMAGEVLAQKSAQYGLQTLVIRPFSGYGEGQSLDYPVPAIAARALRREDPLMIWGSDKTVRDFIHVDDIVAATVDALDTIKPTYYAMNIGSGRPATFVDIARICAKIVRYEPEIAVVLGKPTGVAYRVSHQPDSFLPGKLISLTDGLTRVITDLEARNVS